ncbi:MAG: GGDEF domain-containing protein [Gammaproteobacteria bacterium]
MPQPSPSELNAFLVSAGKPAAPTAADLNAILGQPTRTAAPRPSPIPIVPEKTALESAWSITKGTVANAGDELGQLGGATVHDMAEAFKGITQVRGNLKIGAVDAGLAGVLGTAAWVGGKETYAAAEAAKLLGAKLHPAAAEAAVEKALDYTPKTAIGEQALRIMALPLTVAKSTGDVLSENILAANPDARGAAAIADVLPTAVALLAPFRKAGVAERAIADSDATKADKAQAHGIAEHAAAVDLAQEPAPEPKLESDKEFVEKLAGSAVERDRRLNAAMRMYIDKLQTEDPEAYNKLITHDTLTGLPNDRAWALVPNSPVTAIVDMDSLKWANTEHGYSGPDSGDERLKRVAEALRAAHLQAFRIHGAHGDEFGVQGNSRVEVNTDLHAVADALATQPFGDGTVARITWGIGEGATKSAAVAEATKEMMGQKARREALGKRAGTGKAPPDFKGQNFDAEVKNAVAVSEETPLSDLDTLDAEIEKAQRKHAEFLKKKAVEKKAAPQSASDVPVPDELSPEEEAKLQQALIHLKDPKLRDAIKRQIQHNRSGLRVMFPSRTGENELAAIRLTSVLGRARRAMDKLEIGRKERYRIGRKLGKEGQMRFLYEHQTGRLGGPLATLKEFYAGEFAKMIAEEQAADVEVEFRKNYFSQYFLNWNEVHALWTDDGKERVGGKQAFQYQREFEDIVQAVRKGAKPISLNPEDIYQMRAAAHIKIMAQQWAINTLKENSLIFPGERAGPGQVSLIANGRPLVMGENTRALLVNGFFDTSLWDRRGLLQMALRGGIEAKGMIVPLEIGLSLFHVLHVGLGVKNMHVFAEAFNELVDHPVTPATMARFGSRMAKVIAQLPDVLGLTSGTHAFSVKNMWDALAGKDVVLSPREGKAVQAMMDVGFRPRLEERQMRLALQNFKKALSEHHLGKMFLHVVPMALRAIQAPIMDYYIPYLKTQAFVDGAMQLLADHPELEQPGDARVLALGRLRRNIDERFGQIAGDTLFWNKRTTEALQAAFLSYGWQYGFAEQFGGGAADISRMMLRTLGKKKAATYIGSRAAYAVTYTAYTALLGGLAGYLLSGTIPKKVKDLLYPVWMVDKDGKERRLNTMFFDREFGAMYYHYQAEGVPGLGQMLLYKASPVISLVAEQMANKNFYDQQISDPEDPVWDRLGERAKAAWEQMTPFALQGPESESGQLSPSRSRESYILAFLGANPAPGYVSKSQLVEKIYAQYDIYNQNVSPYQEVQQEIARRQLRGLYQTGQTKLFDEAADAVAVKYSWTDKQTGAFLKSLQEPDGAYEFQKLPPHVQLDLMQHEMTHAEVEAYFPLAQPTVREAWLDAQEKHP